MDTASDIAGEPERRVFVFTNVYRFGSDASFTDSVESLGIRKDDAVVFVNRTVPLRHICRFSAFNGARVFTLHRRFADRTSEGYIGMNDVKWLRQHNTGFDPEIFGMYNDGLFTSESGKEVCRVDFGKYTDGKIPTAGYLALFFAKEYVGGVVVPVNFYGSLDNSTKKLEWHDWDLEEREIGKIPGGILLEDNSK